MRKYWSNHWTRGRQPQLLQQTLLGLNRIKEKDLQDKMLYSCSATKIEGKSLLSLHLKLLMQRSTRKTAKDHPGSKMTSIQAPVLGQSSVAAPDIARYGNTNRAHSSMLPQISCSEIIKPLFLHVSHSLNEPSILKWEVLSRIATRADPTRLRSQYSWIARGRARALPLIPRFNNF